jgi:hypothetical protein
MGLEKLVGKTIAKIDVAEWNNTSEEGRSVSQVFRFTMSDGTKLYFMAEDGDAEDQYSTLDEVEIDANGLPSNNSGGKWHAGFRPVR